MATTAFSLRKLTDTLPGPEADKTHASASLRWQWSRWQPGDELVPTHLPCTVHTLQTAGRGDDGQTHRPLGLYLGASRIDREKLEQKKTRA